MKQRSIWKRELSGTVDDGAYVTFEPLPGFLLEILTEGGLVKSMKGRLANEKSSDP